MLTRKRQRQEEAEEKERHGKHAQRSSAAAAATAASSSHKVILADAAKRRKGSPTPKASSLSTKNPAHAFLQVTDPAFTKPYHVSGLHPRAQVYYCPAFVSPQQADQWKERLLVELLWYKPTLKVYGRDVIQSRQIAGTQLVPKKCHRFFVALHKTDLCLLYLYIQAYATDPDLNLKYSGHPVTMHSPFPPLLADIAAKISHTVGKEVQFNHVMANLYEDGSRYIGKHRDNRENLCIASLSLGANRRWIMERAKRKQVALGKEDQGSDEVLDRKETLANGSLLVMQGDTQELYTHEIPKEPKVKDLRISLTFRQLINKQ
ncbi:hypothetical protein OC845_003535 [Tilletia horrida]|nr:hypothetical protein OC845_003535 [Tilletia horrida]